MNNTLFSIGDFDLTTDHIIGICIIIIVGWLLINFFNSYLLPLATRNKEIPESSIQKFKRIVFGGVALFCVFLTIAFLNLDFILYSTDTGTVTLGFLILFLIVIEILRAVHWAVNNLFIHDFYTKRDDQKNYSNFQNQDNEIEVRRTIRYIVIFVGLIFLIRILQWDRALFSSAINGENVSFRISDIFEAVLIFLFAQVIVWVLIHLVLYGVYKQRKVDVGSQYAINQLLKYIIYVIAIVLMLDKVGLNINLLLGGAAALLVGIGLGLQQTFNDFMSGIVLLFERTVSVGDVLQVGDNVGVVKKIGLRASTIETRGNITLLVPNSKLVNETAMNWTHFDDKVRFDVNVSVAYGSDTQLVKKLLLDVAKENPYIINYPAPFVRFNAFGESSLDFTVYYFSRNFIVIEDIKSDMRFEIDKKFKEHSIEIPYPQRVVWQKKEE